MSLWEFMAVMHGIADANTPENERGLGKAEIAELSDLIDEYE